MKISLILCLGLLIGAAQASVKANKTLEDIQTACSDPASIGNQNAPSEINVTCTGEQQTWQVSYDNSIDLAQSATSTSSATTDKDGVGADETSSTLTLDPVVAGCPLYTKVNGSATGNFMATCEELANVENLNVWCAVKLVDEATANPELWVGTTAGEAYNPCTDTAPEPTPPGEEYPVTKPAPIPDNTLPGDLPGEGTPTTPPEEGTATVHHHA